MRQWLRSHLTYASAPATLVSLAAILVLASSGFVAMSSPSTARSKGSRTRASGPAAGTQLHCGDTITADATLDHNLTNCPDNGIIIGADDVTLDLNDHTIDGDRRPTAGCDVETEFCDVGVVNDGHDGVTLMDGSIRQFGGAVNFFGPVRHNRLLRVSATSSADVGIQLYNASDSVIRGSSANSSPNRHRLGFGLAVYSSHRLRIVGNSFRSNTGDGIHTVDSDGNLFARNLVAENGVRGIVLEGGEGNEIRRNRFIRNDGVGITLDPGIDSVVKRNRVIGGSDGIRVANGRGNLVAQNTIVGSARAGVRLGLADPPLGGSHNLVRRNRVTDSRHDGFVVMPKDGDSLMKGNLARGSGDDGFDIRNRTAKLTRNRAVRNEDLGIAAVHGVRDGGGNVARRNGDPRQCTNIVCRQPPSR
jgi:parallel beta-helix repeat protein